jgi:hypothetical protein
MLSPPNRQQHAMSATGSLSLDALSEAERLNAGQAPHGTGDDLEDIDELFEIDWATANFAELETQWRAELTLIEKVQESFYWIV